MSPVTDDQVVGDDSIAKSRSRRTKKDKTGRLAALERLKQAKSAGGKNKYELTEESNVYEEVDEEEYSKIVRERREDDWIVDDDGAGYAEDGREIFDEDLKDGDVEIRKGSKKAKEKKKANPNIRAPDSKPKSIRSMFAAAAVKSVKRKVEDVNLKDDDVLGDIMAELHQEPSAAIAPAPIKLKKKAPKASYNPFAVKPAPSKRPVPKMPVKAEPSREPEECFQSPKVKKVPLPRRVMKTALDSFNDDSAEIDDFPSQTTSQATSQTTSQTNGKHEGHASQQIDESSLAEDTSMEMEISGIDFDDDFDQENEINGHDSKQNKNAKIQVRPVDELPEAGVKWETIKGGANCDIPMDVQVDASQLPLTTSEDGQHQVLRMYWLDAYEDPYKQPGVVYLFGKVWIEEAKSCVSCCVTVRNIERKMFLLPRNSKMNLKTQEDTGEQVTFLDVYKEFNDVISEKYKIMVFKAKKCVREYAFEKADIPVESEYLELRYSAEYPALPADLKGETFSHIFGTNTSSLENFLLEQKIKGPSWLDIKMPQIPNPVVSWCKVEAFVNKPEYVSTVHTPSPPPPLVVMTLNLRTVPEPKTHQIQIVGIACLVQHKFHIDKPPPKQQPFQQHFCAITTPNGSVFPFDFREQVQKRGNGMKVEVSGTERALLGFLLAKIHKADPDIIVGHDVLSFDLDVLLHRINLGRVPHWSRLGRLKRANMPKLSTGHTGKFSASASATCGRLVCDVKVSSKELIRCRSYDLTELVSHILKEKRQDIDPDQLPTFYNLHITFFLEHTPVVFNRLHTIVRCVVQPEWTNIITFSKQRTSLQDVTHDNRNSQSSHLLQLTEWTLMDSSYILKILYELNVMPLAAQITNICGNVMSRTLMGGRSERNEYLLLHAFTEKNFVVPDKASYKKQQTVPVEGEEDAENTSNKKSSRRKPAYSGGLVLEPKKGFYDKFILLLDFNSLYPSIIQEYNICFTTISRTPSKNKEEDADNDWALELPDSDLEPGVLPTEIRKLVQSRKQVKQLMKSPDVSPEQYLQYDIRQKALKLTANSMYGCLGFTFSRFYAKPLAALVTGKGREILLKTKDMVQNMNLDVIYGDTDSIMVNTNSTDIEQVFKLGTKIKNEVNKLYKLLEIDIDGVFKSMLLLKKKKYAALTIQKSGDSYVTNQELKGLDIVRRDWCELAKEAGNFVISQILSGESRESIVENIHSRLIEVGQKVKDGEIPVDLYLITKQLTKNPEDYPDKKNLAHVQVALRVNSKGGKTLRGGDTVRYLICEDGSTLSSSQRAYSPAELEKRDDLKIDTKYYLANQIHPVVSRLCDPIDGTDTAHIAECLGLDPTGYRHSMRQQQEDDEDDAMLGGAQVSPEEKYRDCERLRFNCPACGKEIILDAPFIGAGSVLECSIERCPNLECKTAPAQYTTFIQNKITLQIRAKVKKYYEGWLKCEDSACGTRTRKLPLEFYKSQPGCPTCHRGVLHVEYPDGNLYNQLCFYYYLFDIDKAISHMKDPIEKEAARYHSKPLTEQYRQLKSHVDQTIKHSAYSEVDLSRLFDGLFTMTGPR